MRCPTSLKTVLEPMEVGMVGERIDYPVVWADGFLIRKRGEPGSGLNPDDARNDHVPLE